MKTYQKDNIVSHIKKRLTEIGARPFFLCVSGSDAYGFASENNSDIDIRGAYYFTDPILMFNPPKKLTRQMDVEIDGVKFDCHLHEVMKLLNLMKKSNMNVLDWIFSNEVFYEPFGITMDELRTHATNCIDVTIVRHALGWSNSMYQMSWDDPKKILHALRPLMTVIQYTRTGEYISDIQELAKAEWFMHQNLIPSLIHLKKGNFGVDEELKQFSLDVHEELVNLLKGNSEGLGYIPLHNMIGDTLDNLLVMIRIETLGTELVTAGGKLG